jgi:hypothetical protein
MVEHISFPSLLTLVCGRVQVFWFVTQSQLVYYYWCIEDFTGKWLPAFWVVVMPSSSESNMVRNVAAWEDKTNSMQHNFCKANSSSAIQGIPIVLCNLKAHYHVFKNPPVVCVLSQIILFFCRSILMLCYHLCLDLQVVLPFRFPNWNPVYTCAVPHTFHVHGRVWVYCRM